MAQAALETVADTGDSSLRIMSPGEFLQEELMAPYGITSYRLAKDIGVPQTRIEQILDGKRAITLDTAARLARYFGISMEMWLNLQHDYELRLWRRENRQDAYTSIAINPTVAARLRSEKERLGLGGE